MRAELPVVGGLGEREQVLVSAWLTGLRSARTRRAYAEDVVAWLGWLADRDTGALAAGRVHVDLWAATQLDDGGSYLTDRPNSPARAGDSVRCGRVRGAGGLRARQIARDEHAENGDQHARGHGPQPDLDPDPPRCRPGKRCLPARGRLTPPVPASDLTPGRRGKAKSDASPRGAFPIRVRTISGRSSFLARITATTVARPTGEGRPWVGTWHLHNKDLWPPAFQPRSLPAVVMQAIVPRSRPPDDRKGGRYTGHRH